MHAAHTQHLVMLPEAVFQKLDASALESLAEFFTHEARRFKDAADRQRALERERERAKAQKQHARARFVEIGRAAVTGDDREALMQRENLTPETLSFAAALYRRTQIKQQTAQRDLQIWKALKAGAAVAQIAAQHKITPRRVRQIAQAVEMGLNAKAGELFSRPAAAKVSQ